jgi:ubiquinone biosynthesis accessory factor UbiK
MTARKRSHWISGLSECAYGKSGDFAATQRPRSAKLRPHSTLWRLPMFDFKSLDEITQRLSALLPPDLGAAKADLERNFHAVLQSGLKKMDLVTREEFDVQCAVLLRTREKLEALEAKLEAQLAALEPQT